MTAPVAPQRGGARGMGDMQRHNWREAMIRAYEIRAHAPGPARINAVKRWRAAVLDALDEADECRDRWEG